MSARPKKSTGPGVNGRVKRPKKGVETGPPPAPAAQPAPAPEPEQAAPPPFVPIDVPFDYRTGRAAYERPASAAELVMKEQEWLWAGYMPKGLFSLIVGDSTAGKSTLLAYVAACVSSGHETYGRGGLPPHKVLYYAAEDDPGTTVRPRLIAAGAILRNVYFGGIAPSGKVLPRLMLPDDLGKLSDLIGNLGVSLVILDPITAYLAAGVDQNRDQQVRPLLDGLMQIAETTGATILAAKNYRKSRDGGPLEWVGGAPAWTQVPRVVLACGFDPDDRAKRVMVCSKNTLTKDTRAKRYDLVEREGVGAWVGGPECDLTAEDLGAAGMTPGDRDALGDACLFLLDELAEGIKSAKLVNGKAEEVGISRGTLRRAKAKLGITSHATGPNNAREWIWRMPLAGGANPPHAGA